MKSIMFLFLALGFMSCFEARPTLKDITIESFKQRHDKNVETLSVLCPTFYSGVSECIERYELKYTTYNGINYLYEIKYK